MQVMYIGQTRKVGDIDLKHNRVYTDRPEQIINQLQGAGYKLADKLFVPLDNLSDATKNLSTPGTPEFIANKKLQA